MGSSILPLSAMDTIEKLEYISRHLDSQMKIVFCGEKTLKCTRTGAPIDFHYHVQSTIKLMPELSLTTLSGYGQTLDDALEDFVNEHKCALDKIANHHKLSLEKAKRAMNVFGISRN